MNTIKHPGGQHRAPASITTFAGETSFERQEPFPPLGEYCYRADGAEPLAPYADWLRAFEAELNAAITEGWADVVF